MDNTPFLTASHIVKRFAHHTALNDVSISVPRGKIFGLLGPNGAGKTTLIRIINRITAPDSGEVTFDGHPFEAGDVANIGYLPEERGLYKKMNVGEQAVYLARLKGLTAAEATDRLTHWFNRLEIMPWWDKKLEELSKGMQQKVQFVITVLHEPQLLIFDEPFSGFDPVNAELLKREMLRLRDAGHTIIFSTHNMASVEELCDEIALINHSQVVLSGSVEEVKRNYRTGTYEAVTTAGTLTPREGLYDITAQETQGTTTRWTLRKTGDTTNSSLFTALAGQAELQSVSERLPTMQEIFLRIVGDQAPSQGGHTAVARD